MRGQSEIQTLNEGIRKRGSQRRDWMKGLIQAERVYLDEAANGCERIEFFF